jgi:hypothetical protein
MSKLGIRDPARPSPAGLPLGLLCASAVGAALAHQGAVSMPFQIGAVMDARGASATSAGLFGFLELGALALSMIACAPLVARIAPALLALGGTTVAALANMLLYALDPPLAGMCAFAALAGVGYGAVFAATIAGVSGSAQADRIFALSSGGSVVVVVALMTLFPAISARFGTLGPFFGIGVLLLATAPLLLGFGWKVQEVRAPALSGPITRSSGAVGIYLAWTGFSLGSGVAWSFAERIGHGIGLDNGVVAAVLSASTFVGIGGTLLAAWLVGRLSRLVCAAAGLIGTAVGLLLFPIATGPLAFTAGALMFWVSSMFFYCVMLGTAAAIDPSGRVGTSGGGFDRLGFACGAPLGGLILDHASYPMLGVAAFLVCAAPGLCALPLIRRGLARAA